MKNKISVFVILFAGLFFINNNSALAGNIDSTNKYAYGENIGYIDFGSSEGNVVVESSRLTGYAYSSNIGWISLNCSNTSTCSDINYGVTNDGSGDLSGYAWSENAGWIDFSRVFIENNGIFGGYAYSPNIGYISFNCSNTTTCNDISFYVSTSWGPATAPIDNSSSHHSGGGGGSSHKNKKVVVGTPTSSQPSGSLYDANRLSNSNIDLTVGTKHTNVKKLQELLNKLGYRLTNSGVGSPGMETDFFGGLTAGALARFQRDNGIVPALGYFGPKTRALLQLKGF